jgi:hypothetical protein
MNDEKHLIIYFNNGTKSCARHAYNVANFLRACLKNGMIGTDGKKIAK